MCLLWSSVDGWKCVRFLLLFHPLVPVTVSPKSSFLNILLVLCVISVLCGARYYLCLLAVHGTICVFWWCTALSVCSGGAQHYLCVLGVHGTICVLDNDCVFCGCMALSVCSGGAQHYLCVLGVHGTICVLDNDHIHCVQQKLQHTTFGHRRDRVMTS